MICLVSFVSCFIQLQSNTIPLTLYLFFSSKSLDICVCVCSLKVKNIFPDNEIFVWLVGFNSGFSVKEYPLRLYEKYDKINNRETIHSFIRSLTHFNLLCIPSFYTLAFIHPVRFILHPHPHPHPHHSHSSHSIKISVG